MENKKIYSIRIHNQFINQKQTYKSFDFEKAVLKNSTEIEKQKSPLGRYRLKGEWVAEKKDELDYVEITQHDCGDTPGKSIYPDLGSIEEFIIASQKALNFLDKYNINYWKLEKPVKIVNDKDVKEKYYLIEFTDEHDVMDWKASELFYDEKEDYYFPKNREDMMHNYPTEYFRDDAVNIDGIYKVKYREGVIVCNSKTKTLLEESGLTGFGFRKKYKFASEKPKEKTFVDKLLGK